MTGFLVNNGKQQAIDVFGSVWSARRQKFPAPAPAFARVVLELSVRRVIRGQQHETRRAKNPKFVNASETCK